MSLDSPHSNDPIVNRPTAAAKTRRVPNRSAIQPLTGTKTATLTVTDSANNASNKAVTINAYDPPTAAIPATGQAQVGVPYTFPITATTPAGTAFHSWNLYGDWLTGGYDAGPPATLTHTFTDAGTYPFTLTVANDAQGTAVSSEMVITVQ